jgi:hypothetical protein
MDDGDGPRSPIRRAAPRAEDRPLRAALVAVVAAGLIAVAVLAAALASPPASAVAPAQAEPASAVESTAEPSAAEASTAPDSRGDTRALAWWMAGEVGVLVVGGAIWCRRATRRQATRLGATGATAAAGATTQVGRSAHVGRRPTERRPSPRYRL